MARDHHSTRRFTEKSGMHLFDFNETLSGKRLPEERRAALEYQVMHKNRTPSSPVDLLNSRATTRQREDGELMRNVPKMPGKVHGAGGERSGGSNNNREVDAKQRGPSVVARLMGLDTLPNESRSKTPSPADLPQKHSKKKPAEYQVGKPEKHMGASSIASKADKQHHHHHLQYQGDPPRIDHHPDRRRAGARELPELQELEEMKRQLSMKQMLVREKLNEAKRLLTGEKLPEKKWAPPTAAAAGGGDRVNQSKEFLDAIDFFHSNRDAFLRYVDDQDSLLGKHIQNSSVTGAGAGGKLLPTRELRPPVPESLRNPILRKVIEGRREDVLRNSSASRHSDYGGSDESFRHPVPESHQVATRIVVLKPSPNRVSSPSPTPSFSSPAAFEYPKPQAPPPAGRKVVDAPPGEEATTNPREIAKEIARQVRESVVRDLARSAAAELGSERRLNVSLESFEGPKLSRSEFISSPARKANSLKPKVSLDHLHFEETGRKLTSSRKPPASRSRQVSSGSSPPPARPVSKGIVVLIPDQSSRSRSGKLPEVQSSSRRDRNRKGHEIYLDHSLGDSFRKPRERRLDFEVTANRSGAGDPGKAADEVKADDSSSVSGSELLGSGGGSFLLNPPVLEPQAEENEDASCECSETKEAVESSELPGVSDSPQSSPELTSSCESMSLSVPSEPSTVTINQCEEEEETEIRVLPPESPDSPAEVVQEVQVPPEEDVSKASRMSSGAEAPDVDGTSVSSENSGQPSPISVLDSSFEDSPPRVDFDTISSELEELRIQLRLLKWDTQEEEVPQAEEAGESREPAQEIMVDKVVVEEIQKPASIIVVDEGHVEGVNQELWLELDNFDELDAIPLVCPEGRKEEQLYVRNVLLAAKLIRSNESSPFLVECYSPRQALDPVLFEKVEAHYRSRRKIDDAGDLQAEPYTRLKRRHLFDAVNEILTQRFCFARPPVSWGGFVLGEVWSKLCDYFDYPEGEDLQHTVENLIEKYMSKGEKWMDLRAHVEAVGAEVERLILCDLIEESVSCLSL